MLRSQRRQTMDTRYRRGFCACPAHSTLLRRGGGMDGKSGGPGIIPDSSSTSGTTPNSAVAYCRVKGSRCAPTTTVAASLLVLPRPEQCWILRMAARSMAPLFARQLREAGHAELEAAKREYFNAEILAREVLDKGVRDELKGLRDGDASIHSLWEHQFNAACEEHAGNRLPGLHLDVMADVRAERSSLMASLKPGLIHLYGMVHRVVEDGRAGWVRCWRDVAEEHVLERPGGAAALGHEGASSDG